MGPHRKRQRLSEDGTSAVSATADTETFSTALEPGPDDEIHQQNLQQRRSLFIRSLAPAVTTESLTEHFSQSYPIKHAVAVLDPTTRQCKGFGFVTFADAEDAQRAKDELNGSEFHGRRIIVEVAEPRHRDLEGDVPGHRRRVALAAAAEAKAKREQERKEQQPPKLIVRNLPWSIRTPDDLTKLFLSYGKVKQATLPKKPSGELKGFGFVLLRGKKNAEKALEGINGKEVEGRTLAVDWAVDKETWQRIQLTVQEESAEQPKANKFGDGDEEMESSEEVGSEEDNEDSDGDSEADESNTDYEDITDSEDGDGDVELKTQEEKPKSKSDPKTLFIRNLPFSVNDDSLFEHFRQFGPLRYARIVVDHETEKPRGTGFVSFHKEEDAIDCLKGVPRTKLQKTTSDKKDGTSITVTRSILEDEDADPTGRYTIDGRILQITRAVDKGEATRLTAEGAASRFSRDKDKRRLYLLSEGTIPSNSPLYQKLSSSEIAIRESSAKQRQKLIQSNPSLHLSLTRLAVRNIPRSITGKDLKALARQAVVGFAADVKSGKRQKLSKEELERGGEVMVLAEKIRKKRGKGIVKQAKVVFETTQGSKVTEGSGVGRSRGYGFIEYYTHRNALMGLRWLNGHAVDYRVKGELPKSKKAAKEAMEDRKKRLIVEFAIENANVVARRSELESKSRDPKTRADRDGDIATGSEAAAKRGKKRKRDSSAVESTIMTPMGKDRRGKQRKASGAEPGADAVAMPGGRDEKVAQRSRIIRKKRMARRAKKAGRLDR
ncbi:nucleolar protein 4 [Lojkania enalia]|uniref:Nucleolar protein 4 n=1 Tax=Lojkania enalia TaxID=147567 RepID=A0A9P4KGG4_9PLEO|nr:nucleolar protein 4 [Didymosphaeria enalia]